MVNPCAPELPPSPLPEQQNGHGLAHRNHLMIKTVCWILGAAGAVFAYWWIFLRMEVSTDDAYVNGNQVPISSDIEGIVTQIYCDETQVVNQGDLVVSLDKARVRTQLDLTKDRLAGSVRQVVSLFDQVYQLEAQLAARKAKEWLATKLVEHRRGLVESGAVALEELERTEASLMVAAAQVVLTERQLDAARAQVEGTTPLTHPMVLRAKETARNAFLDWKRSDVYAPVTGVVAQRTVQVGEHIAPGSPLFSIIPLDQMWVNANYKETQLERIRIGQRVKLISDLYGSDVQFDGVVVGINAGSGSVFSLLPPQNATGNWIKIVQRVPVRISLDAKQLQLHPLWLGLSMTTRIDLHDTDGKIVRLPESAPLLYKTDVFQGQFEEADPMLDAVIWQNLPARYRLEGVL